MVPENVKTFLGKLNVTSSTMDTFWEVLFAVKPTCNYSLHSLNAIFNTKLSNYFIYKPDDKDSKFVLFLDMASNNRSILNHH